MQCFGISWLAAGLKIQLLLVLLSPATILRAHPLQAEPVNHPYVFGFDQFYLPEDPSEHLVEGGLLLLAELRCTACHPSPTSWSSRLDAAQGPDLSLIGSRLNADSIWRMIRSPQHTKKGTLMPGLFTGAEGDAEDVEALTEYLSSLTRPPSTALKTPSGDSEAGKRLYHQVGCVACHEPATDYLPPAAPRDTEIEKPGLASVPLVLAEAYAPEELAAFLQNPLHIRPSGRMPAQQLSAQEAADITAYLQLGEIFESAVERAILQVPPQGIDRGKSVFSKLNCQACHQIDHSQFVPVRNSPLIQLDASRGCLSESRRSGVPFYQLNPTQRQALKLAVGLIQESAAAPTAFDPLGWKLARLNCYACHDRDGKGGPEDPRAQYFSQRPLPETPGFHPYPMPPSLDAVENALKPDEVRAALRGRPSSSGDVTVRMPNFGKAHAEDLFSLFQRATSVPAKSGEPVPPSN